jgi:hypothetical protein
VRQAEIVYRDSKGEFLPCPPTPRAVPQSATPWPNGHCFERVGFAPERPVRLQVEAVVKDGRLLLVGRSDPDGDGVPRVWYLDAESEHVRGPE